MKIHEKLRTARELRNWSQEEIAEKLGMSLNGYAKIERGETKAYNSKLKEIANVLGLNLMDLFSTEENNTVFLIGDNTNSQISNIINASTEIALELKNTQLIIQHQQEKLEQKEIEVNNLKEIIKLLKQKVS